MRFVGEPESAANIRRYDWVDVEREREGERWFLFCGGTSRVPRIIGTLLLWSCLALIVCFTFLTRWLILQFS